MSRVRCVFDDLGVLEAYMVYEEESYRKIERLIESDDGSLLPKEIFSAFLRKIYKRNI